MNKLSITLMCLVVSISLVGCSSKREDIIKESITQMESLNVTQEYKDTVRSIGNKLFIDNELELLESVSISDSVKVDISYYIQENKSLSESDKNVADHDEDLDTGESQALPDVSMDYSSLGIPTTPVDEIEQNMEIVEELMRVKIIEESYYSNTAILKYGNDTGSIFKILEVDGNSINGINKITVKER